MTTVFLVVLRDRHVDDVYAAFTSRPEAIKNAQLWIEEWGDGDYDGDWGPGLSTDGADAGDTIFFWHTFEDGPSIQIQIVYLDNPEA